MFLSESLMEKFPRVGVGVIVKKDGKVLALLREGAHGKGTWSIPGGHLEFNESWEECAIREVFEETGVEIENIKLVGLTNDIFEKEEKHYITLFMFADWKSGEPYVKEPEKCPEIVWADWQDFPKPVFLPLENFRKNYSVKI